MIVADPSLASLSLRKGGACAGRDLATANRGNLAAKLSPFVRVPRLTNLLETAMNGGLKREGNGKTIDA
jgi:hypothetical protein